MGFESFEGHDVIASGIELPGASGGLNKALRVDNLQLGHGQTVYLVMECDVAKVRFDDVKDTSALERVHVLKVRNASTIDGAAVADVLEAQARRVEEAKGVHRLEYSDEEAPDAVD